MALVTVTADFQRADGTPAEGWLYVWPHLDAVYLTPDPTLVTRARDEQPLDETGTATVHVMASDDPEWQAIGPIPYVAKWAVSGSYGEQLIVVPSPGPCRCGNWSTWRTPRVIPTPIPGPEGPPGAASTVPGPAGPPGATGPPGAASTVPGPAGPTGPVSTVPGPTGPTGAQGVPGATGPQGVAGPTGPQGATGAPGASTGTAPYEWKTNTAATDPAHGFIKANTTNPTTYTSLYVSVYDKDGHALLAVNTMDTGDDVVLYEAGQIGTWNRYTTTGPPVLQGTPTEWAIIPVVYAETGPLPFTPAGNTQVVVVTPVRGEPGPTGPQGPQGIQGVPGATGAQGIQGVKGDTGATGSTGSAGAPGATGPAGPGVPAGGATDQVLKKTSATDYATGWATVAAGGSTILSGTATPTAGVGAVGDYYLDTDDRVLYGPKGMVAGPPEYLTNQPTATTNGPGTLGMRYRFLTAGQVVGVRF